eukprot:3202469-Amphidinium_carterae.1
MNQEREMKMRQLREFLSQHQVSKQSEKSEALRGLKVELNVLKCSFPNSKLECSLCLCIVIRTEQGESNNAHPCSGTGSGDLQHLQRPPQPRRTCLRHTPCAQCRSHADDASAAFYGEAINVGLRRVWTVV